MSTGRDDSELLVVTENGYGKKTKLSEYKIQTRGGVGMRTYKISEQTGKIVGIRTVTDKDDIMLITSEGIIIRMATEGISTFGRSTKGVRLMRLDEGVQVVSIARTEHEDEDEENPLPEEVEKTEENSEEITE